MSWRWTGDNERQYQKLLGPLRAELYRASESFGPFNSAHEGWAVIHEEMEELWAEVMKKQSQRSKEKMREEAIQIAAMAVRFIIDLCPVENNEESE